jgi:hypothetical protein
MRNVSASVANTGHEAAKPEQSGFGRRSHQRWAAVVGILSNIVQVQTAILNLSIAAISPQILL